MFKKRPQIKNLSPLRSSDRRKLADQIIADYQISVPVTTQQSAGPTEPVTQDANITQQPTLTSIRSLLLPDNTSSARFTTTSGPNATLVTGNIYVGSHPGQDERILWYSSGHESRLIPTVYTLWNNPALIPLLHTADFVVEDKLKAGADLMTPGLFKLRGKSWDIRAKKGSLVAVAGTSKDSVPVWVGVCEIDVASLPDSVQGSKGVAVRGLHWEGDEVWAWSAHGQSGRAAPEHIDGWQGTSTNLETRINVMDLNDEDPDVQDEGGVALESSNADVKITQNGRSQIGQSATDELDEASAEESREPTTKEIDDAFLQAFLYSIHLAKKQNHPPNFGFDFPIQASFLIANMIQPHLRFQNQHYNIKKTSWKNTKKFIKYLDKQVLVKSKDRNGGETVILDIDFNDQQVKEFQPYKLPKPKPKAVDDGPNNSSAVSDGDPSLGQNVTIVNLYRASSKLVPNLLPSKTAFYTAQEITSSLKAYIEANAELTSGVSISRNVKLDPFLANNVLGSNSTSTDHSALRAGQIDRGQLNRRILEDDHLCVPFHVILRNDQTYDPDSSSTPKPKPGPAPMIQLTIEKRTGSKLITKISGLEAYNINPQLLAPELQKKCAGSASVGQLVGGKPGMMEIMVQGEQTDILIKDVLAKRGIKPQWVDVVDKAKKKKTR